MVRIADRVWEHWREVEEWGSIELLFTSSLLDTDALSALEGSVGAAFRELARRRIEAGRDEDGEVSPGDAFVVPVPGGVALRIDEHPEDFEGLMREIVSGLDANGVDGAFDLHEPHPVVEVPERVDLLECRLRLSGELYRWPNYGFPGWRPEPGALAAAADLGIRWCVDNGAQLQLSLAVRLMKPVVLRAGNDLRRHVGQAIEQTTDLGVLTLVSASPHRFRGMAIEPREGRLTLVEGGATIDKDLQAALQALRASMQAAAPWAVYGFVKRGSKRLGAQLGTSLSDDWVPVLHRNAANSLGVAFEDKLAPDAFGMQLLGPGYAGRIPGGPEWRQEAVAPRGVILEHTDPEAWFGRLFAPFGGHPVPPTDPAEIPEVVSRARSTFTSILFTDDMAGFPSTADRV